MELSRHFVEHWRAEMDEHELREADDAMRDARNILENSGSQLKKIAAGPRVPSKAFILSLDYPAPDLSDPVCLIHGHWA